MRSDLGWRLDPSVAFLNHGSFGACPDDVLAVQREWADRLEREPVAFLERELEGHLETTRRALGEFLGADPDGLAFMPNATAGVNAVLQSLRFDTGDELLTDDHEYNAILNAVLSAADRAGARAVVARIPFPLATPEEVVDAVLAAVTPRTRLAVISHVTSPTGLILPIERIVAALAERGIDTLVDGAHAPGLVPLALDDLGAAYYTGNGHKWLCAPKGSAFLWVRRDRRDLVHPLIVSHGANDPRTDRSRFRLEFDWMGTPDPMPAMTMPAAIDWVARLDTDGWPGVMAHNRDLALLARRRMLDATGEPPPAPDSMIGAMVAVPLPRLSTDQAAADLHDRLLDEDQVQVPVHGWPVRGGRQRPGDPPRKVVVRVSAQRYNDVGDIDRLIAGLRRHGAVA